MQIKTGEGKSLTLAVTAAVLALLGKEVYSACYSSYLSDRDYHNFLFLFERLGVVKNIHYGTFQKLAEHVINENGDVRELVNNIVTGAPLTLKKKKSA